MFFASRALRQSVCEKGFQIVSVVGFEPPVSARDLCSIGAGALGLGRSSVERFETRLGELHGRGDAAAFGAGRVALAAILDALKIGHDDEVIVPAYTCVAVPNPVLFCGALPIYADVEARIPNIDIQSVRQRLSARTRAVIVQHTFGYPIDMRPFLALAREHGFALIEDCTHALGARYDGRLVGTFGDAAFYSFEQSKVISTGQGGSAYSEDESISRGIRDYQRRCQAPQSHQVSSLLVGLGMKAAFKGWGLSDRSRLPEYYLTRLGLISEAVTTEAEYRCELPEAFAKAFSSRQAGLGVRQLDALEENLAARRRIATRYFSSLEVPDDWLVHPVPEAAPAFLRFPLRVPDKQGLIDFARLRGVWIGNWFSAPVHPLGVPQDRAGYSVGDCPQAELAVARIANLPCHPRMTDDDVDKVLRVVNEFAKRYAEST